MVSGVSRMNIDKCMKQIAFETPKKNRFQHFFNCLLIISISLLPSAVNASNPFCCDCNWRPVLALGGGYLFSTMLGESQNFPIQNPITDSFYNYSPNHNTKSTAIVDGFLGIEWGLGDNGAGLQLGVSYDQIVPFTVKGTLVQGADINSQASFTYQYDITLSQVLFGGKLLGVLSGIYHPYFFGGVGAAFNRASQFTTNVPPFLTFTKTYASNANTVFTYAVGVGLDVDLDQVFRLGAGYRFSNFGKVQLGNATIDTTPVPGTLSQRNLYTNEILLQITCLFN